MLLCRLDIWIAVISNEFLIYCWKDPQWFYLCRMFLKLSHKSSRTRSKKRRLSPSSPVDWLILPSRRADARSAPPLDDPLRYIWCQRERLVFLLFLWFPVSLLLPLTLLISSLVWSAVAIIGRMFGRPQCQTDGRWGACPWHTGLRRSIERAPLCSHPSSRSPNHPVMENAQNGGGESSRWQTYVCVCVRAAQQKQLCCPLWVTFFSNLFFSEVVHTVKPSSRRTNIISGYEVIWSICSDQKDFGGIWGAGSALRTVLPVASSEWRTHWTVPR